jgi:hypothetical protein
MIDHASTLQKLQLQTALKATTTGKSKSSKIDWSILKLEVFSQRGVTIL